MKISESARAGFSETLTRGNKAPESHRASATTDYQTLSLPAMLALTRASHPDRESFLNALSQALKAGLYTCAPEQIADAVLARTAATETASE